MARPSQQQQQQQQQKQDDLAVAQNGGQSDDEGDMQSDDDMDDDLMDKISSSPSIEDGGSSPVLAPAAWPRRVSSLPSFHRNTCLADELRSVASMPSFACSSTPLSLQSTDSEQVETTAERGCGDHHLLRGEYFEAADDDTEFEHDEDALGEDNDALWAEEDLDERIRVGKSLQQHSSQG